MIDKELWGLFFNWLDTNSEKESWGEMGLLPNAPQSAIDAYNEFLELEKKAKAIGAIL